ncbi:unnamed protein product [Ixodes pacificus]
MWQPWQEMEHHTITVFNVTPIARNGTLRVKKKMLEQRKETYIDRTQPIVQTRN